MSYYFAWGNNPVRAKLKGLACTVICRGKRNSVMVEFKDGTRVITSRYAIRKEREE